MNWNLSSSSSSGNTVLMPEQNAIKVEKGNGSKAPHVLKPQ
jgi:hypothetical protein